MKFPSPDFLADLTHKLTPGDVAELFPFAFRYFPRPPISAANSFEFVPQRGEMTRFGVFFYALTEGSGADVESIHRLLPGEVAVLVDTGKLLTGCIENPDLAAGGVLICPSQAYLDCVQQVFRARPDISPYVVDEGIQRNNVVVDLQTLKRDIPPILSIPALVKLTPADILRQWQGGSD